MNEKLVPYFEDAIRVVIRKKRIVTISVHSEPIDIPLSHILYLEANLRVIIVHLIHDERQCKSEKFPAQNNPSCKKRIHKTSCHYFYAWGLDCPHSGNEHGFSCHETGNCSFHATDCKFSAAILSAALS